MSKQKITDVNLYELLGVDIECDQADIRKAYRKKALECHPDKNPDNPKAAETFHELSKALEILIDSAARKAYDNVLKAKKAAELRNKQLDSKRQKLKADLEQREQEALLRTQAAQSYSTVAKSNEEELEDQIKKLRQEGSKLLEEELKYVREELARHLKEQQTISEDSAQHRLKLKWNADKKDANNGGYSKELLENYLRKYGEINAIVMSKKVGSALVEFKTQTAAEMALDYEKGLLNNPLTISWVTPPKPKNTYVYSSTVTDRDYEDLVMRKLRQAEERKRLIEQMQREENE